MIINNQYQFIYIHVPKTAGTSVSATLQRYAGPSDIDLGGAVIERDGSKKHEIAVEMNRLWMRHWGVEKHSRVMRARAKIGELVWSRYFKFAFVRNPFSKTYSGFKFAQRNRTLNGVLDDMSFQDFLRTDIFQKLQILPIQSQATFLSPVPQMDFIGRFETLEADLGLICSIIERRRATPPVLETLNRSADPDDWRKMSEEDKDIIREVLSADFDELGYSKDDGSIVQAT